MSHLFRSRTLDPFSILLFFSPRLLSPWITSDPQLSVTFLLRYFRLQASDKDPPAFSPSRVMLPVPLLPMTVLVPRRLRRRGSEGFSMQPLFSFATAVSHRPAFSPRGSDPTDALQFIGFLSPVSSTDLVFCSSFLLWTASFSSGFCCSLSFILFPFSFLGTSNSLLPRPAHPLISGVPWPALSSPTLRGLIEVVNAMVALF